MNATRRTALSLLAAPALARPARAAARALTVASLFGEDKPETQVWRGIAAALEAAAPGRFALRIVGNAALGGEKQVAEAMRLGAVQGSLFTVASLTAWVPGAAILDLPYLFRDRAHLARVLAGPLGAELRDAFAAQGFTVPGFVDYGARHLIAKQPITTPAGIRAKHVRVIQSPIHAALWEAYGAYPVPIPIPETYDALKSGIADAMDLTPSAYAGFRLDEVAPYLTTTGHIRAAGVLALAAPSVAGLNAEDRAMLTRACIDGIERFDALIQADEAASLARVVADGARVIDPEDAEDWQAGGRRVWERFAPSLGGLARIEAVALER